MQIKWKQIGIISAAVLMSAALTACGGKKTDKKSAEITPSVTSESVDSTGSSNESISPDEMSSASSSVLPEVTQAEEPKKSLVAESVPKEEETSEVVYTTTKKSIVNVRTKPSEAGVVYSQLAPGTKLNVIGEKNGWYQIKLNGGSFYIKATVVDRTEKKTVKKTAG